MKPVHVVLVPGADGLPFPEDVHRAERQGAVVHALEMPGFHGHPIDACRAQFAAVSDCIASTVSRIRERANGAAVVGIGRNLGGSHLAWHAAERNDLDALVLAGAIPDLSRFRAESDHEGARRFRASLAASADAGRIGETAAFDLSVALRRIGPASCLAQAGTLDPWLDDTSFAVFRDLAKEGFRVEFLSDNHRMVSSDALAQRWDFIAQVATP